MLFQLYWLEDDSKYERGYDFCLYSTMCLTQLTLMESWTLLSIGTVIQEIVYTAFIVTNCNSSLQKDIINTYILKMFKGDYEK